MFWLIIKFWFDNPHVHMEKRAIKGHITWKNLDQLINIDLILAPKNSDLRLNLTKDEV